MAFVLVKEFWVGRSTSQNDQGDRDYARTWRVVTDSAHVSALAVRTAPGIPRRFDPYQARDGTADLQSLAKEIDAQQEQGNPFSWVVTVRYSTRITQPEYGDENPLNRPAELSGTGSRFARPVTIDTDGNAILTSSKENYDPPVEVEDKRIGFTYTRFEAYTVDPLEVVRAYDARINSAQYKSFDPGWVRCDVGYARVFEKALPYWKFTYAFEVKDGGWDARVLDQGYVKLVGGVKVNITDKYGKPIASPALLDGAGGELAVGAAPVFRTHKIYYRADFNELNLV